MSESKQTEEKDESFSALVEWLCARPQGEVLVWSSDTVGPEFHHALCEWVDINLPQAQEDLQLNWVWTIEVGGKQLDFDTCPGAECCALGLPEEGVAIAAFAGDEIRLALACYDDCNAIPLAASEIDYLRHTYAHHLDGMQVYLQPFARVETISQALRDWVVAHTDRSDISFRFDPNPEPSPLMRTVMERIDETTLHPERLIEMRFDDPAWVAEHRNCSLEEAEAWIAEMNEQTAEVGRQLDEEHRQAEDKARQLLARYLTVGR